MTADINQPLTRRFVRYMTGGDLYASDKEQGRVGLFALLAESPFGELRFPLGGRRILVLSGGDQGPGETMIEIELASTYLGGHADETDVGAVSAATRPAGDESEGLTWTLSGRSGAQLYNLAIAPFVGPSALGSPRRTPAGAIRWVRARLTEHGSERSGDVREFGLVGLLVVLVLALVAALVWLA